MDVVNVDPTSRRRVVSALVFCEVGGGRRKEEKERKMLCFLNSRKNVSVLFVSYFFPFLFISLFFISLLTSFPPFPSSDVRRAREPTRRECRRGAAVLERLGTAAVVRERRRAATAPLRRSHLPRARALAADMLHLAAAGVSDRSSSFQVKHPPCAQMSETLLFVLKDA